MFYRLIFPADKSETGVQTHEDKSPRRSSRMRVNASPRRRRGRGASRCSSTSAWQSDPESSESPERKEQLTFVSDSNNKPQVPNSMMMVRATESEVSESSSTSRNHSSSPCTTQTEQTHQLPSSVCSDGASASTSWSRLLKWMAEAFLLSRREPQHRISRKVALMSWSRSE